MEYFSRKPTRIPNYDYSKCNYYFLTLCTYNKKCIFGLPNQLNQFGCIVKKHLQRIPEYYTGVIVDKFVVMPNHIHIILILNGEDRVGVPQIIGQFKTGVTKEIRKVNPDMNIWQRSFHDHIIRNQESYEKIWLYIEGNPQSWEKDCFYIHREG